MRRCGSPDVGSTSAACLRCPSAESPSSAWLEARAARIAAPNVSSSSGMYVDKSGLRRWIGIGRCATFGKIIRPVVESFSGVIASPADEPSCRCVHGLTQAVRSCAASDIPSPRLPGILSPGLATSFSVTRPPPSTTARDTPERRPHASLRARHRRHQRHRPGHRFGGARSGRARRRRGPRQRRNPVLHRHGAHSASTRER